jgi:hypothetical protein
VIDGQREDAEHEVAGSDINPRERKTKRAHTRQTERLVNHRLVSRRQMLLCLGDSGVGAAMRAEAMTAGVEGRFKDRLQDLEHGLLNYPVHHVDGDLQTLRPAQLSLHRRSSSALIAHGVSMWVVYYWINGGLITAQKRKPGLPYAITITDATDHRLRDWVANSSRITAPSPNPN